MREPNFFLVGAAKSGTTSLYHYLDQHPAVYMSPIKEPCFFAPEVARYTKDSREFVKTDAASLRAYLDGPMDRKRTFGIVREWDQYLKLFKHVRDERAVGEASVSYLTSIVAPHSIRARIPDARIIAILRDPAARLYSQYAETFAAGHTRLMFMDWVSENAIAEAQRDPPFGPVWTSRYAPQLQRYLDCFPREHVRIYLYDDYATVPAAVLRDVLEFLEVDPEYAIDTTLRHNVTKIPRWPSGHRRVARPVGGAVKRLLSGPLRERAEAWWFGAMLARPTPAQRAAVIRMYEDDIGAVERCLGRDLSPWRDPNRAGRQAH